MNIAHTHTLTLAHTETRTKCLTIRDISLFDENELTNFLRKGETEITKELSKTQILTIFHLLISDTPLEPLRCLWPLDKAGVDITGPSINSEKTNLILKQVANNIHQSWYLRCPRSPTPVSTEDGSLMKNVGSLLKTDMVIKNVKSEAFAFLIERQTYYTGHLVQRFYNYANAPAARLVR